MQPRWTVAPVRLAFAPLPRATYREDTKTVLYRSKMNPTLKRNFALFPVMDWIAEITTHIPDKREQLVRYYGAYSNVSRGKRKKEKVEEEPTQVTDVAPPPISRELSRRWSHFIQKVYRTYPLFIPSEHGLCPIRRSTTATAFLSDELLIAQDSIQ